MHVFYLHGFASSAASTKAAFFAVKLSEHGIPLHTPDFNAPDFSTLTITRMVDQVAGEIARLPAGPVVLIGSSLGAFVAVQVAVKARVDRLVLLAPALEFATRRDFQLGDRSLDEWERTGATNVFHYGFGRVFPVHFKLYSDACRYDCINPRLELPIQVFIGRNDTVVDPSGVEKWASARPNVDLHLLDDEHQLANSLEQLWTGMRSFLGLNAP